MKNPFSITSEEKVFTPDVLAAPMDETVCWCAGVTKGRILEQARGGAKTLDDIRRSLGACTQGQCKEKSPRGR